MDIKIDVYKEVKNYIMIGKSLLDITLRVVIIMVPIIGYEIGSQVVGTLSTIVLFGTGFIASVLLGLYGQWYNKYIK
jgi:hypothetical protein